MLHELPLTKTERVEINWPHGGRTIIIDIVSATNRSQNAFSTYLLDSIQYGSATSLEKPRTLSSAAIRAISCSLRSQQQSTRALARTMLDTVGHETVWRELRRQHHFAYQKMQKTLNLSNEHKGKRIVWYTQHAYLKELWSRVTFRMGNNLIWTGLMIGSLMAWS